MAKNNLANSDKVYIVDGSGYIFRAYYAVQPLSTKAGLPTNALFGFARMLKKLLGDLNADYIAVAFDTGAQTFRHEMYDEYKANREECPADLVPQMPYFRKIVKVLGIPCYEKDGFEADDIIATLATRALEAGREVVVVSGDKDLSQLVCDQLEVWDAMRDIRYTPAAVEDKFGVGPDLIGDYLAIVGDSSDNIPGVKGVGPKGAQQLLRHFGTLEELLARREEIAGIEGLRGAKSISKKVEDSLEMLKLSRELVRLDTAVEPYNGMKLPDELEWKGLNESGLAELFNELEFETLRAEFISAADIQSHRNRQREFVCVTTETWPSFLAELREQETFAFDTETTSLNVQDAQLLGMSFCWEEGRAYYLPLSHEAEPLACLNREDVLQALAPIFSGHTPHKVAFNAKYDIEILHEQGVGVRGLIFDPMLASYVLRPDIREHGLSALSLRYLHESMRDYKEVVGDAQHLGQVELAQVVEYAAHDAEATWRLYVELSNQLADLGTGEATPLSVLEQIEVPLVLVLAEMELAGVKLDQPYLESLENEFSADASRLQGEVYAFAGEEFNLNSPKQVSEILFGKLGLPTKGVKKTKTGFSTDASVLQRLASEHEIVDLMLEYREVHKLMTTYVQALQRLVSPKTGRIHTSFNQAIAATGRLSSSEPNLQNIPIKNPRGRRIREAFIAEEGSVLLSADYSQIELRILAHLSGDQALCAAFCDGEDIHARTARQLFSEASVGGDESSAEFARYRRYAKTINFGIIYGMSSFRLARELGISRKEAGAFIERYFAQYPRVRDYFEQLRVNAEQQGYVETIFGRRRYVEDLETEGRDAGYTNRSMMNAPIQGSAAEIIKIAMLRLHHSLREEGLDARMLLQVHDELVFEIASESLEEAQAHIVSQMENAVDLRVPLKVSVNYGANWGKA